LGNVHIMLNSNDIITIYFINDIMEKIKVIITKLNKLINFE